MKNNQVSQTALESAFIRAYHAAHDTPKIFDDFLASRFVKEELALIEQNWVSSLHSMDPTFAASFSDQADALAWMMQVSPGPPQVLGRARYAEDSLEKAVSQGVQQYVILGAGMDTFAFRHPEMLKRLHVFEVDHPATQDFKRNRIDEIGWEQPAKLQFVPLDFTQESLAAALLRSSYDQQSLGFFSLLGVTMYLNRDAVFDTLHAIADIAPSGSTVIFDYLDTDAFVPEKASKRMQFAIENIQQRLGESLIAAFDPSALAEALTRVGLRLHENLSPIDIEERYYQGRTDGYHACEHVHFAWAVVG